jgi:hypothetical protein
VKADHVDYQLILKRIDESQDALRYAIDMDVDSLSRDDSLHTALEKTNEALSALARHVFLEMM